MICCQNGQVCSVFGFDETWVPQGKTISLMFLSSVNLLLSGREADKLHMYPAFILLCLLVQYAAAPISKNGKQNKAIITPPICFSQSAIVYGKSPVERNISHNYQVSHTSHSSNFLKNRPILTYLTNLCHIWTSALFQDELHDTVE